MAKKSKKEELDLASDSLGALEEKKETEGESKTFFKVGEGMSLTSKRGVLSAGDEASAKDFVGGAETLKMLVEKGFLVESSH
jgi:hypothetical protein